jgi:hypothetical protein
MIFESLGKLIETIRIDFESRGGRGVDETLLRLELQNMSRPAFMMPPPQRQPVCVYLPEVITAVRPFVPRQAGDIIWHPSMIAHATITHEKPLLAVYAWTQNVETGAKLVETD